MYCFNTAKIDSSRESLCYRNDILYLYTFMCFPVTVNESIDEYYQNILGLSNVHELTVDTIQLGHQFISFC